ncbi:hypothetical protein AAC387_Pa05g2306 [Persea americana]
MDAELLVDDVAGKDHGSTDDGWGSMSSSDDSIVLSSTLDFSDDGDDGAMSSSSSSSMTLHPSPEVDSNGPLYELSQLLVHLPIKRGLSRHYQGKSQSFTSLSNASCIEDLAKKSTPCSRKMMKSSSQQLRHYLLEFPLRFETCRILQQGESVISSWRQRLELSDITTEDRNSLISSDHIGPERQHIITLSTDRSDKSLIQIA